MLVHTCAMYTIDTNMRKWNKKLKNADCVLYTMWLDLDSIWMDGGIGRLFIQWIIILFNNNNENWQCIGIFWQNCQNFGCHFEMIHISYGENKIQSNKLVNTNTHNTRVQTTTVNRYTLYLSLFYVSIACKNCQLVGRRNVKWISSLHLCSLLC